MKRKSISSEQRCRRWRHWAYVSVCEMLHHVDRGSIRKHNTMKPPPPPSLATPCWMINDDLAHHSAQFSTKYRASPPCSSSFFLSLNVESQISLNLLDCRTKCILFFRFSRSTQTEHAPQNFYPTLIHNRMNPCCQPTTFKSAVFFFFFELFLI